MVKLFDFVSALPSSLSIEILSGWLEVKDVARLDSSMLNSVNRQCFLDLIKFSSFTAPSFNRVPSRTSVFVSWLAARSVKVSSLDFSDYFEADVTKCMMLSGAHLTSVKLKTRQEFNMIRMVCSKLVQLIYATNQPFETAPLKDLIAANAGLQVVILHYANNPDAIERAYQLHGGNYQSSKSMYIYSEKMQSTIVAVDPPTMLSHLMEFCFHALKVNVTLMDNLKTVNLAMQCSQLKSLGLAYSAVDDETILTVVRLCPHIIHLDLTHVHTLTPVAVEHIALHLKIKSLILDDNYGFALTSASLAILAQHTHTSLSLLSIRAFVTKDTLFKQSISNVLSACNVLKSFSLHGIEAKNNHMSKLVKLHISDTFINNRIFQSIGKNCPSLTHLCLQDDCPRTNKKVAPPLDEKHVHFMLEKCINLRIFVCISSVYSIVAKIVKSDYAGRIKFGKDWRDMKMSVMDQPI